MSKVKLIEIGAIEVIVPQEMMFDWNNQQKLLAKLSPEAREKTMEWII